MRQVLQQRSGETVVADVPCPACPPGGVLVANAYSAISAGTESVLVEQAQKSLLARVRERPDLARQVVARVRQEGLRATRTAVRRKLHEAIPVGYSSAGAVIEVGEAVSGLRPGDLVACAGAGVASHAEVVAVPRNLCARVPEGVGLDTAALTTIGAIALHGIRLAEIRVGDRVAVVGCGLVGRITLALLRATGAEILAFDLEADRLELARRDGADHVFPVDAGAESVVRVATDGAGVDAALITAASSSNAPVLLGASLCRDRGALVIVGDVPTEVPRSVLFEKELSLRVSRSYGPGRYDASYEQHGVDYPIGYVRWTQQRNMEAILGLQARGRVDFGPLIEAIVPLDEAASAYERITGPPAGRPRGALVLSYEPGEAESAATAASPAARVRPAPRVDGPVRLGLLGPGEFARGVIVPAFESAGVRLEAVAGGSGPTAAAAVRDFGFDRTSTEDALVDDASVNALAVCTRHATHASLSARALRAGKHVFCEKPLALSLAELDEVMDAAAESGGVLAVGFNRRFAPLMRELREFLRAEGGPLTAAYRVSAGAIPDDNWVHDLVQGGGRALGEACHFVDTLTYLTGAPVQDVHAIGHGPPDRPVQAHDNLLVNLRFRNGSVGSLAYVAEGSPRVPKERVEAFSGRRTAVLDDFQDLKLFSDDRVDERRAGTKDKGHRDEIAAFVESVRSGTPPVPLDEVRNVSMATFAIVESLRTGRPVSIDSLVTGERAGAY